MKNWQAKIAGGMTTLFFILMIGFVLIWPVGCRLQADPVEFTLTLYWTAPGDNGNDGMASEYDLRYSTEPITQASWFNATQITDDVPVPEVAGTPQQASFTFMAESDITVYFAMKSADEVPNWSGLSNIPAYLTPDIIPPAAIVDLREIE